MRRQSQPQTTESWPWTLPPVDLLPPCEFCSGEGDYPIHNRRGGYAFSITCPGCGGTGRSEPDA